MQSAASKTSEQRRNNNKDYFYKSKRRNHKTENPSHKIRTDNPTKKLKPKWTPDNKPEQKSKNKPNKGLEFLKGPVKFKKKKTKFYSNSTTYL